MVTHIAEHCADTANQHMQAAGRAKTRRCLSFAAKFLLTAGSEATHPPAQPLHPTAKHSTRWLSRATYAPITSSSSRAPNSTREAAHHISPVLCVPGNAMAPIHPRGPFTVSPTTGYDRMKKQSNTRIRRFFS